MFTSTAFTGSILVQSLDNSGYTINSSTFSLSITYIANPNASVMTSLNIYTV